MHKHHDKSKNARTLNPHRLSQLDAGITHWCADNIYFYEACCASLTTLASGEYAKYLASSGICAAGFIENRYGAFEVAEAGLLDVPGFVGKTHDLLLSKGKLIESKFEYADLRLEENGVRW